MHADKQRTNQITTVDMSYIKWDTNTKYKLIAEKNGASCIYISYNGAAF